MSRPRGGYVGFNRVPAAAGFNSAASGVWTLREAEALKRAGTWPSLDFDGYFSSVSLLLHMDGSNGATTFTDSSSSPKTLSRFGDAAISTAQSKFGGSSLSLDGAGDYLTSTDAGYQFGTGDFTVECWAYNTKSVETADNGLFQIGSSASNPGMSGIAVAINASFVVIFSNGSQINGTSSATQNTWTHIALVRSGSTLKLYLNGTQEISVTNASNLTNNILLLGAYYNTSYPWQGYIDEFRVTKGVARYTTNFTPPPAAFPNA